MRRACLHQVILSGLLLLPSPPLALALTAADSACRDEIAKSVARYAASVAKTLARCHQRRSAGSRPLDVNCNEVGDADLNVQMPAAADEMRETILAACTDTDVLANYTGCPAPAASADDGGATAGIDDLGELVDCLHALADSHVSQLSHDAAGNPPARLLDPLRKCQNGLGKGTGRILRTILAERRRCQGGADRGGASDAYGCDSSDARGRIFDSRARFERKVGPICSFSPDVLERLEACSKQADGLIDCSISSALAHGGALIRSAYTMSGATTTTLPVTTTTLPGAAGCGETFPQCDGSCPAGSSCRSNGSTCSCAVAGSGPCAPATIRREILSNFSPVRDSSTSLNAGWSGIAHGIDVPDGAGDYVDVTCDDNCENCAVSLNLEAGGSASNCRCTSNPAQTCNVINGSDPESCGSLDPTCRCYFGAPLPITSAGNPACVGLRIRDDYQGTMNLRTGEWFDVMHIAAVVYLGVDKAKPCPVCEGDVTPNDGIKDGMCSDALTSTACDVNGVHSTFGSVSNDCLPPSAANISGAGLLINLNLSTSQVQLGAGLPCDTPQGRLCHCRTCTGNSNLSCSSDAQCAAVGAGACTAAGGSGVRLNQCTDYQCSASGDCTIGPVDRYCDGALYPDGRGYVPCTSNTDCTASDAGTCSSTELRRCFPDPIVYTGQPDTVGPTSVSAFCVAPTSNPAINIAAGLPGPGALLITFDNDVRCQSDFSLPYEFPDGANCSSAVTTTTLLPLPGCNDAEAPACGGLCPTGETCTDNQGLCECTSLPLPACDGAAAPVCGGICTGEGQVCTDNGGVCSCMVLTLPQCSGADAPLCGGLCPTGEICASVGDTCECGAPGVPSCGSAIAPTCAGLCDVGQACVASGDACTCLTLPVPTCAQSAAPLCGGTCSLGSLCGQVGDACECTPIPIQ